MKPMRILMLAQFYPPIVGGEEQHVHSLSQELAARGHSVAVATLHQPDQPEYEEQGAVRVHRVGGLAQRLGVLFRDQERRHAPPLPDPETTAGLYRVVRRERPQIVHAHNWLLHSFLPLKAAAGAPLVATLHDYSLVCAQKRLMRDNQPCPGPGVEACLRCAAQHYGPAKGPVTAAGNWLMRQAAERAVDLFLPVSRAVAAGCGLAAAGRRYQVVPNFVPAEWDDPSQANLPAVAELVARLPAGEFLLFVGDLSYDKGLPVLLEAYARLESAPPLVLIGRRRAETPAVLPPNVIELGCWPHAAVMEAWRRCTLALMPSVWAEPFGIVALEAMSAGRPIIATTGGGLADIVSDGETGLLTPPADGEALRAAMARLLADPDLARRMGAAGKVRLAEYQAGAVVGRIEQIYERLLAAQQPAVAGVTPWEANLP